MKRILLMIVFLALYLSGIEWAYGECDHEFVSVIFDQNDRYESYDSGMHSHWFARYRIQVCLFCGFVGDKELEQETTHEYEEHTWRRGICVDCGETNYCEHMPRQECEACLLYIPNEGETATPVDELRHTFVGSQEDWVICRTCREPVDISVREENVAVTEWHWFIGGVCITCGYDDRCYHEETTTADWYGDAAYAPLGDGSHSVTVDVYERTICDRCYEELECTPKGTVRSVEEHVYVSGECIQCSFANPCAHTGETGVSFHIFDGTCEQLDDSVHVMRGPMYEMVFCKECGEDLSEELCDPEGGLEKPHCLEDGVCTECGYQNSCVHEHTDTSVYVDRTAYTALDPDRLEDVSYVRADAAEALDDQFHVLRGDRREKTVCADCGVTVSDVLISSDVEETERHQMNGLGECIVCGYCCTHEQTFVWDEWSEAVYERLDGSVHRKTGDRYRMTVCYGCGVPITRELAEANARIDEAHLFQGEACMFCGEVNTCVHEQTRVFIQVDEATYTPADHWTHSVSGTMRTSDYCILCAQTIPCEDAIPIQRIENHSLVDGMCIWCSLEIACTHELLREVYSPTNGTYAPVDERTHMAAGVIRRSLVCRECRTVVERSTVEADAAPTEVHVFNQGECVLCGYANGCDHKRVSEEEYIWSAVYARLNVSQHFVHGPQYRRVKCADCGETLTELLLNRYFSGKEAHYFEDGVCLYCGEREAG